MGKGRIVGVAARLLVTAALFAGIFALQVYAQEPEETAEKTHEWTYLEIVNSPDFRSHGYPTQFSILLTYFLKKGTLDEFLPGRGATWTSTKIFPVPYVNDIAFESSMHLLQGVLSPDVLWGLANDPEFQEFFPQYCKYYLPFIEQGGWFADLLQAMEEKGYVYGSQGAPLRTYVPILTIDVIRLLASKAPAECGGTMSDGWQLDDSNFFLVLGNLNKEEKE